MERVATEPNLFLLYIFMLMSVDLNRKKRIILLLVILNYIIHDARAYIKRNSIYTLLLLAEIFPTII